MISEAAKTVSSTIASTKDNGDENHLERKPFKDDYAIRRSDNTYTDEIPNLDQDDVKTCPSNCRCECPRLEVINRLDALSAPKTVGNSSNPSDI